MISYFSVWNIKTFVDLKDLKKELIKDKNKETIEKINWQDKPLKSFIEYSEIDTFNLKELKIEYMKLQFHVETQKNIWYTDGTNNTHINDKTQLLPREERTNRTTKDGFIFEHNNQLKLVLYCGVDTAKKIRNTLIKKWCKLELVNYFNDDLFFWLYWHNDIKNDLPLVENEEIYIDNLVTYTGVSQDEQNEIKVDGDRVPALLATLGSIFSSKKFKHLKIDLKYLDEIVEVDLKINGTYKINLNKCFGNSCEYENQIIKLIYLILFIDLKLFPKIYYAYKFNCSNNIWNEIEQLNYTDDLGKKILEIVNNGLELNREKLLKLNEINNHKLFRE